MSLNRLLVGLKNDLQDCLIIHTTALFLFTIFLGLNLCVCGCVMCVCSLCVFLNYWWKKAVVTRSQIQLQFHKHFACCGVCQLHQKRKWPFQWWLTTHHFLYTLLNIEHNYFPVCFLCFGSLCIFFFFCFCFCDFFFFFKKSNNSSHTKLQFWYCRPINKAWGHVNLELWRFQHWIIMLLILIWEYFRNKG
jgi:hypothetical protein